jgi:hypothetical protein
LLETFPIHFPINGRRRLMTTNGKLFFNHNQDILPWDILTCAIFRILFWA